VLADFLSFGSWPRSL